MPSLDASRPLANATLERIFVPQDRGLGEPGSAASTRGISRALQEATVGLALETVGTSDALFQLLLAYIKERKQFGVPIGSFQAVKHKMSNMFLAIERARALCYFAVAAINEDTPNRADCRLHGQGGRRRLPELRRARIDPVPSVASASPGSTTATSTSRGPPPAERSSVAPPRTPSPSPPAWASVPRQTDRVRPGESLIAALGLAPHPEGGWYRRTWVADAEDGTRPAGQRHLLPPLRGRSLRAAPGGRHRAVALLRRRSSRTAARSGPTGGKRRAGTGRDVTSGQAPQAVVAAGVWQSARPLGRYALVGATVTPAFVFEGFRAPSRIRAEARVLARLRLTAGGPARADGAPATVG